MSTPDPEAPKLDPLPFKDDEDTSGWHDLQRSPVRWHSGNTFAPRPEYSQRREDYPNA